MAMTLPAMDASKPTHRRTAVSIGAFVLGFGMSAFVAPAQAQSGGVAAQDVVNLTATASLDVVKDVLVVTFGVSKEAADAQAVQAQLKQALDAALVEAKRVAKPGQVDVQTGNFSVYPRHNAKGAITQWIGSTEMVVQGKDLAAVAQLTGRITSMNIVRVQQDISRETRDKVGAEVTAQAITQYRQKAAWVAKQFGYSGFVIRDVHVMSNDPVVQGGPAPMMQARIASDSALPVESGKGQVSATVQGSVTLTK